MKTIFHLTLFAFLLAPAVNAEHPLLGLDIASRRSEADYNRELERERLERARERTIIREIRDSDGAAEVRRADRRGIYGPVDNEYRGGNQSARARNHEARERVKREKIREAQLTREEELLRDKYGSY